MGTERKEPAPERGERGQPALRNVSRRLLFRPVPGLDEMTTSSQCWRTGLVSAAPVGAQHRHFRGSEQVVRSEPRAFPARCPRPCGTAWRLSLKAALPAAKDVPDETGRMAGHLRYPEASCPRDRT